MSTQRNGRPPIDQIDEAAQGFRATTATLTIADPADDSYAWAAVFLADGRVISIAWLRGYPDAVEGRWRE